MGLMENVNSHKSTGRTQEPYFSQLCRKVNRKVDRNVHKILWKNEECADIWLEATIVNGGAAVAAEGEPMCAVKISMSAILISEI